MRKTLYFAVSHARELLTLGTSTQSITHAHLLEIKQRRESARPLLNYGAGKDH
jgi:hypothetical protein